MDLDKFFALLAYQRSGTNMVGWAVDSHPDMTFTSEVFHRDRHPNPRTFNRLLEVLATGSRPATRNGPEVPYDDPEAERVLVDVKYNQANDAVKRFLRQVPVVHLIRLDDERHWQSFVLRTFWKDHPEMRARRELPDSLPFNRRQFEAFAARKRHYVEWGKGLADLTLVYEDLCHDEQLDLFPHGAAMSICELAGVRFLPLPVPTRKSAVERIPWRRA